jgi:SAM-dependent methyltransferase
MNPEEEKSGERFVPHLSNPIEIDINLERYIFAMLQCKDKVVLDLGCGNGLGTYLYSLVAKQVYAVDYNASAIEFASKYPFPKNNVSFAQLDLTKLADIENLPAHDICVALEFLEHVSMPDLILKGLKGKELVFSVPLESLSMSSWHRYRIDTVEDVVVLISPYYDVSDYKVQKHANSWGRWVYGHGVRFETNA